ncbi:DNA topoisomerase IB [Labedella phragmitis]|uniref:DNA topoisomerase n=1 Tax=Labedella phragmitis TaxID=2498849 RepID=A0A3S3Z6E4_9MICO|nr:DNA topoisomerase IB [Labedella phragmitis]RWZ49701.1 DNA topoisomerase IB [Labedella phragmitis]
MVRLRRSVASGPGWTRRRSGRGFRYMDEDGHTITDPVARARITDLVIPPAWSDVWISPYPNGHIQAVGTDAAGRRQYIYHEAWREKQDVAKFERCLDFAEVLPGVRPTVTRHLRGDPTSRETVLAAMFRILDTVSPRIGGDRYADENGSYGLSTLLGQHLLLSGDLVTLHFPGKSSQQWHSEIIDSDLADVLRALRRRRGKASRVFAWKTGRRWKTLSAEDANDYIRGLVGETFSAKDFRTLHGSSVAAQSLARTGPQDTMTARKKAVVAAVKAASVHLGNTPTIARSSYIDPRVLTLYENGRTARPARGHAGEAALVELLRPGATEVIE